MSAEKVEVKPLPSPEQQNKPKYQAVAQKLEDLLEQSGTRFYEKSDFEPSSRQVSENGEMLLELDYGSPQSLLTPVGSFGYSGRSSESGTSGTLIHSNEDGGFIHELEWGIPANDR